MVKLQGNFFMDPSLEEEQLMGARLTVTTKDNGNVVALQKGGSEALSVEEIEKAFDMAAAKAKDLRKHIK
jgi:exosome complex RNA-binding protein Rrp42 (RNase PH superfamily)